MFVSVFYWWGCRGWVREVLVDRCFWFGILVRRSRWGLEFGYWVVFLGRIGCLYLDWRKWGRCRSSFFFDWGFVWGLVRRIWGCRRSCRGDSRWWSVRFFCRSVRVGWFIAGFRGLAWRSFGCRVGRVGICRVRVSCGGGVRAVVVACGVVVGFVFRRIFFVERELSLASVVLFWGVFCVVGMFFF